MVFGPTVLLVLVIPRDNKKGDRDQDGLGKEDANHQTVKDSWQPDPRNTLVWLVGLCPLYDGPSEKGPTLKSQEEGRDVTKKGSGFSVSLVWHMVRGVAQPDHPNNGPRKGRCQVQGLWFVSGRHNHEQDEEKGIDVCNRRDTNSHILCLWHCLFVDIGKQTDGILKPTDLI